MNTKSAAVMVRGKLNAIGHQNEILVPVCIPHLRQTRGMRPMQDGAPCHTAHTTTALLNRRRINILP